MFRNFEEIVQAAKMKCPRRACVVFPEDRDILRSLTDGMKEGLIEPVIIGRQDQIKDLARKEKISIEGIGILHEGDLEKASEISIEMVRRGEVSFVVKGNILTTYLYKSLLRVLKKYFSDEIACTFCFHQIYGVEKIFLITDSGVNIHPDLGMKRKILRSGVRMMNQLGWERPRVMILASPRMMGECSSYKEDASELRRLSLEGELGECEVLESNDFWEFFSDRERGSEEFPDIFLVPNIETGNILVKSIDHLGMGIRQCVTVGGGIFLLTPSRSDGYETRMLNLSLGVVLSSSGEG
ncbi:MAG: phosphate acyltransferase [Thermodesulfobacteriota bacterium]